MRTGSPVRTTDDRRTAPDSPPTVRTIEPTVGEIMDLEETRAFLAVLDHGSFKAAADIVKQPRATLRRRVEALEARAGVSLLARSHSGVIPTAAGELLARQARMLLRETNALLDALRELGDEPSGELRIGAPLGLPTQGLALLFGFCQAEFPRLRLQVRVCADPISELLEHVDMALHLGPALPAGHWRTHTLSCTDTGLRASRSYLRRHGMPRSVAELEHHKLLGWHAPSEDPKRWPLRDGGTTGVDPAMTSMDPHALRRLAHLGFGIALLPDADAPEFDSDDEALLPVLDGVIGCTRELQIVVPEVLAETGRMRAILDRLARLGSKREGATPRVDDGARPQMTM
jgi:DNA-binding transcriptional LysR family regulator